ncbi:diguanylate cyclase domain-containing protein [Agrobacterium cavarae]|uniref:diguanylate cyclase domain-containing protein n=1 Tax=Agrobacterium cavarae TaxID=2528239 RepID=UPI003EE51E9D
MAVSKWLLDPVFSPPDGARGLLLGQLLSSPLAILLGSFNALIVSVVGFVRHEQSIFFPFILLELVVLAMRIGAIAHVNRSRRLGRVPAVDFSVMCSIVWCGLQGSLAFFIMQTGDGVLMVLSATLVMGIIGPICARNFSAPRYALFLVCLCDLPFKAGAAMSGDPWLLVLLPMTPPFLLGAMQVVCGFQKSLVATLTSEIRNSFLANHDALTGLLNRQGLDKEIAALPGEQQRVAVLGADLDGFKQVNDQYGHSAGDQLLREIATRLSKNVRAGDHIARIGGDEFLLVVKGLSPDDVKNLSDRLISCVTNEPIDIGGAGVNVGISIGYACYPEDGGIINELRLKADTALYAAKRHSKGSCQRFETLMAQVA